MWFGRQSVIFWLQVSGSLSVYSCLSTLRTSVRILSPYFVSSLKSTVRLVRDLFVVKNLSLCRVYGRTSFVLRFLRNLKSLWCVYFHQRQGDSVPSVWVVRRPWSVLRTYSSHERGPRPYAGDFLGVVSGLRNGVFDPTGL